MKKHIKIEKVGTRPEGVSGHAEQMTCDLSEELLYIHVDHFGRLYFDRCKTVDEHFKAPPEQVEGAEEGVMRQQCRLFVEDLFQPLVGRRGRILITWDFEEE